MKKQKSNQIAFFVLTTVMSAGLGPIYNASAAQNATSSTIANTNIPYCPPLSNPNTEAQIAARLNAISQSAIEVGKSKACSTQASLNQSLLAGGLAIFDTLARGTTASDPKAAMSELNGSCAEVPDGLDFNGTKATEMTCEEISDKSGVSETKVQNKIKAFKNFLSQLTAAESAISCGGRKLSQANEKLSCYAAYLGWMESATQGFEGILSPYLAQTNMCMQNISKQEAAVAAQIGQIDYALSGPPSQGGGADNKTPGGLIGLREELKKYQASLDGAITSFETEKSAIEDEQIKLDEKKKLEAQKQKEYSDFLVQKNENNYQNTQKLISDCMTNASTTPGMKPVVEGLLESQKADIKAGGAGAPVGIITDLGKLYEMKSHLIVRKDGGLENGGSLKRAEAEKAATAFKTLIEKAINEQYAQNCPIDTKCSLSDTCRTKKELECLKSAEDGVAQSLSRVPVPVDLFPAEAGPNALSDYVKGYLQKCRSSASTKVSNDFQKEKNKPEGQNEFLTSKNAYEAAKKERLAQDKIIGQRYEAQTTNYKQEYRKGADLIKESLELLQKGVGVTVGALHSNSAYSAKCETSANTQARQLQCLGEHRDQIAALLGQSSGTAQASAGAKALGLKFILPLSGDSATMGTNFNYFAPKNVSCVSVDGCIRALETAKQERLGDAAAIKQRADFEVGSSKAQVVQFINSLSAKLSSSGGAIKMLGSELNQAMGHLGLEGLNLTRQTPGENDLAEDPVTRLIKDPGAGLAQILGKRIGLYEKPADGIKEAQSKINTKVTELNQKSGTLAKKKSDLDPDHFVQTVNALAKSCHLDNLQSLKDALNESVAKLNLKDSCGMVSAMCAENGDLSAGLKSFMDDFTKVADTPELNGDLTPLTIGSSMCQSAKRAHDRIFEGVGAEAHAKPGEVKSNDKVVLAPKKPSLLDIHSQIEDIDEKLDNFKIDDAEDVKGLKIAQFALGSTQGDPTLKDCLLRFKEGSKLEDVIKELDAEKDLAGKIADAAQGVSLPAASASFGDKCKVSKNKSTAKDFLSKALDRLRDYKSGLEKQKKKLDKVSKGLADEQSKADSVSPDCMSVFQENVKNLGAIKKKVKAVTDVKAAK